MVRTVQRTILASGHSAIIDKTDFFNDFFLLRSIIGISNTVARLILGILSQRMNRYMTRMNRIDQIVFVGLDLNFFFFMEFFFFEEKNIISYTKVKLHRKIKILNIFQL